MADDSDVCSDCLASAILAPYVSLTLRASWLYALLSAAIHVSYSLFLVRTDRIGARVNY